MWVRGVPVPSDLGRYHGSRTVTHAGGTPVYAMQHGGFRLPISPLLDAVKKTPSRPKYAAAAAISMRPVRVRFCHLVGTLMVHQGNS
jgi:hypothetical protein